MMLKITGRPIATHMAKSVGPTHTVNGLHLTTTFKMRFHGIDVQSRLEIEQCAILQIKP